LIILLLVACSQQPTQDVNQVLSTSTFTPKITETIQPSNTPTPIIPTETLSPHARVEAALAGTGKICKPSANDSRGEISPDGNWFAMVCRGRNAISDSYLQVINIDNGKEWTINGVDYVKDGSLYPLYPYHWSVDGKYLYASASTRASGCCWIGGDVLMVRLDLENGQQTEIANFVEEIPYGLSFSISADDKYFLSTPFESLWIFDLHTGEKQEFIIDIGNGSIGYPLMSIDDSKVILLLREYPEEIQGDLTYGSLVLVDLFNGSQKRILSGMDFNEAPIPVSWRDNENVLLRNENKYWLLNIKTAELTETAKP
jgi:hypothetical protein